MHLFRRVTMISLLCLLLMAGCKDEHRRFPNRGGGGNQDMMDKLFEVARDTIDQMEKGWEDFQDWLDDIEDVIKEFRKG